MRNIKHRFVTIILPTMILAPLLWLMAGCFYVPWVEHRIDSGPNIRAIIGSANSDREIRPGSITRSRVVAILGFPKFESVDGFAFGYVTHTAAGYSVWPLCFEVELDHRKCYAVRLVFNDDEKLIRFDWAVLESEGPTIDSDTCGVLNQRPGPKLLPINVAKFRRAHPETSQP